MAEIRGPESSQRHPAPALGLSNSGKQMEEGSKKQYVKQVTGRHNDTELHLLVKNEDLQGVKALLNACEDPGSLVSEENELGETPLHIAADRGDLEVLKELLRFAYSDALIKKNKTGCDAFHIAARQGHLGIVKAFLKHQSSLCGTTDSSNATPLISAAAKGHTEVVEELLSADRQLIDISKSNGKNALHLAARNGHVDVVKALLDTDPQMARKQDKKGQTALHMAAKGAMCLEVVQVLLSADLAIVMLPDRNGNTALHVATRKKRVEIVKELLRLPDINVNALNRSHKTALDLADELQLSEEASEIKDALISAGAVKAKNLNQPRDELKQTMSAIKHDVYNQLKQTKRTNKKVSGIAKELRKLHREGINNATNSVTVVAVLFATVAFAAIFTVPGGFVGDNNNQPEKGAPTPPSEDNGTAVVAKYIAFKIFFIFNAIALFTSIAVVVVQITLVPWETKAQRQVVFVINKLMWLASVCTSVSFLASAYIIVGRQGQWMAITVSVIGGVIMVGVLGTMTFYVVRFRRSRSIRRRRSSLSRSSSHIYFSESELDNKIYAI
uniref:PGG domain-containing protein n=1 Tax=Araucaria cunninghamii TaxID=56994 RepID=A0A0D6QXT2_ARACU